MKNVRCITLVACSLLLTDALAALANNVYYPYDTYQKYYDENSVTPPPGAKPAPPPPPEQAKPRPRPEQPIKISEPPGFLFPPKLKFGIAIGVPYDLFYLPKTYYLAKNGMWYRATSYRGPWIIIALSQLPPEIRKYKLAELREMRSREFAKYFKQKEHYQGKYFRPNEEGETMGRGTGH